VVWSLRVACEPVWSECDPHYVNHISSQHKTQATCTVVWSLRVACEPVWSECVPHYVNHIPPQHKTQATRTVVWSLRVACEPVWSECDPHYVNHISPQHKTQNTGYTYCGVGSARDLYGFVVLHIMLTTYPLNTKHKPQATRTVVWSLRVACVE